MDTQKLLTESEYYAFIQDIIKARGQWRPPSEYWEGHHIIPKCLGGLGHARQKHSNIIRLTAAEHFIAHKLLAELFPDNPKLVYAFWAMCTISKSAKIVTAEEYQIARELRSKTIGMAVQNKLLGVSADELTRNNHSKKQAGDLNGFFGKTHSKSTKQKLATAKNKAVRHINTGQVYNSSYEAAAALGINRVLINNCCRGKQASTMGGMMFEYVNPQDYNRGIPGKNHMTKYDRRREIIELRKLIINLNKRFNNILATEDIIRTSKLATCENKHYLISLFQLFLDNVSKQEFEDYINGSEVNEQVRAILADL